MNKSELISWLNAHLDRPIKKRTSFKQQAPLLTCKDGCTFSVQASADHYCIPKDNDGPYTHVEIGFPDGEIPNSWRRYNDGSIYSFLPIELVADYIELHGGLR